MIVTVVILSVISTFLGTALYFSLKKNSELIEVMEGTMEQIEASLEILDYYYKRIDRKSKLELFSDDQTIRELVDDMKQARRAILFVSEKLTGEKEIEVETINQA